MSTLNGHKLFFIGVGGIGMSGLARYFRRHGAEVAGYDRTPSELTNQLQGEGIDVQFSEDSALIPEAFRQAPPSEVMVVRTPAVPLDSPLLRYWEQQGARILKRAEVLGMVTRDRRTVAVAGTHGKTTVSTMLAHLLTVGRVKCNAFLGGIAVNHGTNVLLNDDAVVNVVEADEYDRSFLQLKPSEAIITAMDPDHLDIYGTPAAMVEAYTDFAALCDGPMFVHQRISGHFAGRSNVVPYSLVGTGVPRVENLHVEGGVHVFDLVADGHVERGLELGMPGRHNVENAIAAAAMALHLGVTGDRLRIGLASFRGVARRFEVRIKGPHVVFIDDYAHHPTELRTFINSVRELHPGKRITGVFQPHLFSRTRDLAADFAASLALLDALYLLDIYPAREEPIAGITAKWLLEQVPMEHRKLVTRASLLEELRNDPPEVFLSMGAGDIDRLVPAMETVLNQTRRP